VRKPLFYDGFGEQFNGRRLINLLSDTSVELNLVINATIYSLSTDLK